MSDDLDELYARVENGIRWLTEHDPTGAFHFWFQSGITPASPMPAHDGIDDAKERYTAYHSARSHFEILWGRMVRLERARAKA